MKNIAMCDFCGKKTQVKRTHYGSGFGYVRLICADCQKELEAEIIVPEKKEQEAIGGRK